MTSKCKFEKDISWTVALHWNWNLDNVKRRGSGQKWLQCWMKTNSNSTFHCPSNLHPGSLFWLFDFLFIKKKTGEFWIRNSLSIWLNNVVSSIEILWNVQHAWKMYQFINWLRLRNEFCDAILAHLMLVKFCKNALYRRFYKINFYRINQNLKIWY